MFLSLLIVTVLIASAACSMTEAAILSLPLIRARIFSEEKRRGGCDLLFVKENIHSAVATIVILNNAVNIIGAIFIGQVVAKTFGNQFLGVFSAVMTFAIIIIAEVIPKTIGEHYKARVSLASAKLLRVLMWVFKPFIKTIAILMRPFGKDSKKTWITEEEIKMLVRVGRDAGTVEVDEERLINRVFRLNDLKATQMMKPIDHIYAIDGNRTLLESKEDIINSLYSRIGIYENTASNIIGVCQQRVLLREIANDNYNAQVKNFITKPIFVHEDEKADALLEKFQSYHQHLFIVRDGKGKNVGIITMEDVLEELFGEIYDEKDVTVQKQ
ncbi:MAG: HlyC/CorC family transporter [Candidatus Omnitrophica bacterium]|nr:HlyC/CorC family transporter [Candidatus Omnitrophota bacterium]